MSPIEDEEVWFDNWDNNRNQSDKYYFKNYHKIKKGTNIRAGTVTAAHDGTNITYNEVSTIDLGNTTDVKLQVVKSGSNMVLQAVTLSNDWSVKAFVRAIKV